MNIINKIVDQSTNINNFNKISSLWKNLNFPQEYGPAIAYATHMHSHSFENYLNRSIALPFSGKTILDAGCGTGTWSFPLSYRFDDVYSIDYNKQRVDLAKWIQRQLNINNIYFSYGTVLQLDFPDCSFDAVFCYSVLISYLDLDSVLKEFFRVLKPGGTLYVCLNGIGWSYYLRDERSKQDKKYREMGIHAIYNTICKRDLSELKNHLQRRHFLSRLKDLFLETINNFDHSANMLIKEDLYKCENEEAKLNLTLLNNKIKSKKLKSLLKLAMKNIHDECGPDYLNVLLNDVSSLDTHPSKDFSFNKAGRGYKPDEVQKSCTKIGFKNFTWGEEGSLCKEKTEKNWEPIYDGTYKNSLMVWEFIVNK